MTSISIPSFRVCNESLQEKLIFSQLSTKKNKNNNLFWIAKYAAWTDTLWNWVGIGAKCGVASDINSKKIT